jgi:hypothetical protein
MKRPRHFACCCFLLASITVHAGDLPDAVTGPYPRAFFFRASESCGPSIKAGRQTYETWAGTFSRLGGIMGKSLEEEVPGRSANIPHFSRFKKEHPNQLVMLHYNGNARDPRDAAGIFSPGHWIYFNGCRVTKAVEAVAGEMDIHVEDTSLFRTGIGRYRDKNEDLGICMLDENGRPNWQLSEQVQLLDIDNKRKTLRVRRGCFGSNPRAFPAGKAYVAAHVTEGPWGQHNNIMWFYNYATNSPRDAADRSCTDVLVEDLAGLLAPAGKLAAFDGIEFDVLHDSCGRGRGGNRGPDVNADGKADRGRFDGVNVYRAGVVEFCRRLRERVGEDIILTADGGTPRAQRAFGYLNGIESEGWPWLGDWEIRDWSGGLNRHIYWRRHGRKPVFNFFNHKYTMAGAEPGSRRKPDVPFSTHRLVFVAAQCVDAAICYSYPPTKEKGESYGIWDELRKGTENETGWLGEPVAHTLRLAYAHGDVFQAEGRNMRPGFVRRVQGDGCDVELQGRALRIASRDRVAKSLRFRISNVPAAGPDLVLRVNMQGAPLRGIPAGVPRIAWVRLLPPRGAAPDEWRSQRFMTFVGSKRFDSSFYFRDLQEDRLDFEFEIEGGGEVWLRDVIACPNPDVLVREFEHGLVLANPAHHPVSVDVGHFFPRTTFRRLRGSSQQDPATNNGKRVGKKVTLGALDGLFLVKDKKQ